MAYTANPVTFDGTNDSLAYTTALTGNADSKRVLFSAWFRVAAGSGGVNRRFIAMGSGVNQRFTVQITSADVLNINGNALGGTQILNVDVGSFTPDADADWHHLLVSIDLANAANRDIYLDGVDAAPTWITYTDDLLDLAGSTPNTTIGSTLGGSSEWNGDFADLYFTSPASWFDPGSGGNISKFIFAGAPRDLGVNGEIPLGVTPLIFLSGATGTWHQNKGGGGGFTLNGALTDGAVPLPTRKFILTQPA